MYFPVPNLEEVVGKVAKSKIHSNMELRSVFLQVLLKKNARLLSAFSCHLGHFMYNRMPFGMINAPFTMNKLMQQVYGESSSFISYFFDDIFVHSESIEEHMAHLHVALNKLIKANLQVPQSVNF